MTVGKIPLFYRLEIADQKSLTFAIVEIVDAVDADARLFYSFFHEDWLDSEESVGGRCLRDEFERLSGVDADPALVVDSDFCWHYQCFFWSKIQNLFNY